MTAAACCLHLFRCFRDARRIARLIVAEKQLPTESWNQTVSGQLAALHGRQSSAPAPALRSPLDRRYYKEERRLELGGQTKQRCLPRLPKSARAARRQRSTSATASERAGGACALFQAASAQRVPFGFDRNPLRGSRQRRRSNPRGSQARRRFEDFPSAIDGDPQTMK